jgi:hypothetical protein
VIIAEKIDVMQKTATARNSLKAKLLLLFMIYSFKIQLDAYLARQRSS